MGNPVVAGLADEIKTVEDEGAEGVNLALALPYERFGDIIY